ncbi:AAA family ATPase [Sulfitobacter sp. S190]|uniref:AAA family ATPase n=1 Tax=Sulfitobacter sp. S190 TaxID=2867022 RepID=UPI0021A309E8|nr:AAA family ATPase [Sulfitobacter sp. S190]UWR21368.1 AAA family ATPase [Sulfitobacter sp. S190]
MKLRALHLTNVRRFAGQTASVTGIADGITVVSEANEFGKSTFFDALHALFFTKSSATGREVRALEPHSGGAVQVSADIETAEGLFTIEKSFLRKKYARVSDANGRIVAQDDEAERWIARLMGEGADGPAGLLWVRQGVTGLEPQGASTAERDRLRESRRDVLSSVAGEIDMVTGGRRMDRVLGACNDALEALATKQGRPKTGGAWKDAVDAVSTLNDRAADLGAKCRDLAEALQSRKRVEQTLAKLADPALRQSRQDAFDTASATLETARAHAARAQAARADVDLRTLELGNDQASLAAVVAQDEAVQRAAKAQAEAHKEAKVIDDRLAEERRTAEAAGKQAKAALDAFEALRSRQQRARTAALRVSLAAQLDTLRARISKAEAARTALESAKADLSVMKVSADVLARIDAAQNTLDLARQAAQASAVSVRFDPTGGAVPMMDGVPFDPQAALALRETATLTLPGFGAITIDPGDQKADAGDIDTAERALAHLLDDADCADVAAARNAARARRETQTALQQHQTVLQALAPDGLPALQQEAATLVQQMGAATDADEETDAETLADLLANAQQAAETTRKAQTEAEARLRETERAAMAAQATQAQTRAAFEAATAERGNDADFDARKQAAGHALARAEAALTQAQRHLEDIDGGAIDLGTAEADVKRTRAVLDNAARDIQRLETEKATLDGRIATRAENGVEEALAEVEGQLHAARQRADNLAREVAALQLLADTLSQTRTAAREAYFEPIKQELKPLMSIVHGAGELSFDDNLLPDTLARDGVAEELGTLSGGTREQIAILTRLAFARLFARQGREVPIILDDALVYSDDDRIVKMFTALHRVAEDQQVIVFTCRQMAFDTLGGDRPRVRISDAAG